MLTIAEILLQRANEEPYRIACSTLDHDLNLLEISYGSLLGRVIDFVQMLKCSEIGNGDICLLIFQQGLDFIVAFFACHWVGAIPIPLNFPGRNKSLTKWEKIAQDSGAKAIITGGSKYEFLTKVIATSDVLRDLLLLATKDQVETRSATENIDHLRPQTNSLAFLQYTSGSTGSPKGVIVTQSSLIHNLSASQSRFSFQRGSVVISWLPFYHDMGLIMGILQSFYSGGKVILMSPNDFMNHPLNWVYAISRFKGTHTIAPNFAYELVADKLEKLVDTDQGDISLKSLRSVICGAEPIHLSTLLRFQKIARKFGLNEHVITPGYGLAEATLVVSAKPEGTPVSWLKLYKRDLLQNKVSIHGRGELQAVPKTADEQNSESVFLVSNGVAIPNHEISIRDVNSFQKVGPNRIGEICFSGASVTSGYWANEEDTKKAFVNLENEPNVLLRTGDLGFLDERDELFITGRLKDVIIIRGLNHYPQDIERTSSTSAPGLRLDGAAAFSIPEDHREKLVVIQEIERLAIKNPTFGYWEKKIIETILKEHGVVVEAILFVPPMHVPRTTSGKIQRNLARSRYQNNGWEKILYTYKRKYPKYELDANCAITGGEVNRLKEYIAHLVADQMGIQQTELDQEIPFFELGVNSMMSLVIRDTLEGVLEVDLPSNVLFNHNTIERLGSFLAQLKNDTSPFASRSFYFHDQEYISINSYMDNYDHYSEEELIHELKKELNS